jgi:signal transduction histidine kinase
MRGPGFPLEHHQDAETATLCHDLRQYVAAGLVLAGMREVSGLDPEVRRRLDNIAKVFEGIREALEQHDDQLVRPTPVDLADVARDCVAFTRLMSKVPIDTVLPRHVEACANLSLLHRAVLNLLSNATRAAGVGGSVCVEVGRLGGDAWLEVRDDGAGFGGIPAVNGLGMAVVESAVRSAGGRLEINSGPGPGTRVRLRLPRSRVPGTRP